jgi:hypothetical protein
MLSKWHVAVFRFVSNPHETKTAVELWCSTVGEGKAWLRTWSFLIVAMGPPRLISDGYREHLHRDWLKPTGTEQVSSWGNASDLYSGHARFQPWPGYRLSVKSFIVLIPSKYLDITSITPREFRYKSSPIQRRSLHSLKYWQYRHIKDDELHKYPKRWSLKLGHRRTNKKLGMIPTWGVPFLLRKERLQLRQRAARSLARCKSACLRLIQSITQYETEINLPFIISSGDKGGGVMWQQVRMENASQKAIWIQDHTVR